MLYIPNNLFWNLNLITKIIILLKLQKIIIMLKIKIKKDQKEKKNKIFMLKIKKCEGKWKLLRRKLLIII